jgi:hypothetical protein
MITVEKGFDNRGVDRRLYAINLGRFEYSRGKGLWGRRISGWWNHQMRSIS